ncbi:endonuclease V [Candidatus Bathyarchaeota archaeon]|nr:MAG: endonuclease V [Candidatus Bathyarchaeota archaeon]
MKSLRSKVPSKFSVSKARTIQHELSKKVIKEDMFDFSKLRYIAGVDVAYTDEVAVGAVSVHEFPSLTQVEVKTAVVKVRFPYIPTLLSFREVHPVIPAIKRLEANPDIFMVDGHGLAHPYRLGFASHLGVILGKPSIGVAKRLLCGRVEKPPKKAGEYTLIKDDGEVIGAALLIKDGQKPIYVSIGHMISLETAIKIVKITAKKYRIPEPIRAAHQAANEAKRRFIMQAEK